MGAIKTAGTTYNTFKNLDLKKVATTELNAMLKNTIQNTPSTRNTLFSFPKAGSTPGPIGTAAFPTIGARISRPIISDINTAGSQYNGADVAGNNPGQPLHCLIIVMCEWSQVRDVRSVGGDVGKRGCKRER